MLFTSYFIFESCVSEDAQLHMRTVYFPVIFDLRLPFFCSWPPFISNKTKTFYLCLNQPATKLSRTACYSVVQPTLYFQLGRVFFSVRFHVDSVDVKIGLLLIIRNCQQYWCVYVRDFLWTCWCIFPLITESLVHVSILHDVVTASSCGHLTLVATQFYCNLPTSNPGLETYFSNQNTSEFTHTSLSSCRKICNL